MRHVPTGLRLGPVLLLLSLILGCRSHPFPLMHRLVQNLFEPERLNYWFTLWEKVIHLGRFHVHNVPRILLMPFTHMQHVQGRMLQLRRSLDDLHLRSVGETILADKHAHGVVTKLADAEHAKHTEPAEHLPAKH